MQIDKFLEKPNNETKIESSFNQLFFLTSYFKFFLSSFKLSHCQYKKLKMNISSHLQSFSKISNKIHRLF